MKKPEEIKKGLEACGADECHGNHTGCPYKGYLFCFRNVCGDALAYIQQLESRLAQVERERDVMTPVFIREMKKYCCTTCEHYIPAAYTQECLGCGNSKLLHWKWNGVCPENMKEASL